MARPARGDGLLLVAFLLSGVAALGYELLWTRLLSLALGSETLGVLGVLAGFFGGMAIGAALFHHRVRRSPDPVRLFVWLELIIAGFALVSPHLLYALARGLPPLLGPVAGDNDTAGGLVVSVLVAGIALLPGTVSMGATLPALVEAHRRVWPDAPRSRGVGRLYAANTLGATLGVLGAVHLIMPALGLAWGGLALSAVGALAAGLASGWRRSVDVPQQSAPEPEQAADQDTSRDPDPDFYSEPRVLLLAIFATGLVGVGLEVVGVQILSQVLQNTVYTFANVLAVYLLGTAIGAALYPRYVGPYTRGRPATATAALLLLCGLSVVWAASMLTSAPGILGRVAPDGAGYGKHLLAEGVAANAVFMVPTVLMGVLFTHLMGAIARHGVGRAYALNTLGSALAPFVFGLGVMRSVGYTDGLYYVAYAYLLLFGGFCWLRRFKTPVLIGGVVVIIGATTLGPRSLILLEEREDWTPIEQHETLYGLVSVSEKKTGDTTTHRLRVGKHFRMGGAAAFGERRMGHIPLLLAQDAKQALFLGVGTGATLGAVRDFPELESVDAVELVPEAVDMLHYFEDINHGVAKDPRVTLHAADARRFVAASPRTYDLVVADLFHPARDGAGALYAREHFQTVREHLSEGGLFAQWLPLHQLDPQNFRTIARTFVDVFPETHGLLALYNVQTPAIALVGRASNGPGRLQLDLSKLEAQLGKPVYGPLAEIRELFAGYILDPEAVQALAGEGPLNTDLNPRVLFDAPRSTYEGRDELGWSALRAALEHRAQMPENFLTGEPPDHATQTHDAIVRYGGALDAYLAGELARVQNGDPKSAPPEALEHYLRAWEIEPGFAPARGMLYTFAPRPASGEIILPRMYAISPKDPRVLRAYVAHLKRVGDQARLAELAAEVEAAVAAETPAPSEDPAPATGTEPTPPPAP